MTLYRVRYRKYSSDTDDKEFHVVASGVAKAIEKANAFIKKQWANRVSGIQEIYNDVEVAK
jgi:hypothetical protein